MSADEADGATEDAGVEQRGHPGVVALDGAERVVIEQRPSARGDVCPQLGRGAVCRDLYYVSGRVVKPVLSDCGVIRHRIRSITA